MRRVIALISAAFILAGTLVFAPPASASENSLVLPGGGSSVTLGANAVLRIDGRLEFTTRCGGEGAIKDWAYAVSDVYVLPTVPAAGTPLVDASGAPSTIVQPGSTFIEQVIAITAPSGSLGEGTFSIAYDTCQDGIFDPDEDALFTDAIRVAFPTELPPVDAALTAIKADANTEWGRWQQIGKLFDSLINIDSYAGCAELDVGDCLDLVQIWANSEEIVEWAETAGSVLDQAACAGGDSGACFGLLAEYWGFDGDSIRDRMFGGVKSLIANQAKSFYGLYADPPRDDFTTAAAAVVDLPIPSLTGGGAILDAASEWGTSLQREVALRTAFIAAIERYQGAQAAGDADDAVAQARSAAALAETLAQATPVSAQRAADFFDAVRATIPELDTFTQGRAATIQRQSVSGFTPAEDRTLRNAGIGVGQRGAYLEEQAGGLSGNIAAPLMNLGPVNEIVAAAPGEASRLRAAAAELRELAADIVTGAGAADAASVTAVPTLAIAEVALGEVGAPLTITATASAGASVTWDLDADGSFDDGSGPSVSPVYRLPGHRVIAAKATAAGSAVTAHALVDVSHENAPPVIDGATPVDSASRPAAAAVVGQPTTFTVSAHDPTGEVLRYSWLIDGEIVAGESGTSFDYRPVAGDRGAHTIAVTVQDPHPGNIAQHAWRVRVTDADADGDGWADNAFADCDDSDGDVHPGRLETLFNGKDDDCDASTPDGGSDLGEGGVLWTWGAWPGNPRGEDPTPRAYAPADDVVQIGTMFRAVWWLDASSGVSGYGFGGNNLVAVENMPGPGPVFGIGSASGALQGVAEITHGDGVTYARMADGRVVSWGDENFGGGLGAGVPLYGRNYPDYVLGPDIDGDDAPDPLSGVERVWQLGGAGLARTHDGELYQWGARQCADAGWGVRPVSSTAVAEPALTAALRTMVQADGASNNPGSAIFRMADGSVMACGAERQSSWEYSNNRLLPFGEFGPDDPAVDVDTNGNEWWVVTASGAVWVKTWDGVVNSLPGCTPQLCPPGVLHEVPMPDDWFVVDVEAGADQYLRLADGRLVTFSAENTFGSLGHPVPDNPAAQETPAPLKIDGYVVQAQPTTWNGYAVVLPRAAIEAAGWTPPQPHVTVSAIEAAGPEGGTATAGIHLDRPAAGDLEVAWTFGGSSGTTIVPTGETAVEVTLGLPAPDGLWGADRHMPFVLTTVSANASLGDEVADVTVTDVDAPPTVSLSPGVIDEGDATPVSREVFVELSAPAARDLSFRIASTDGSAVSGVDFVALDQTLLVPAGGTSASAPLIVRGNVMPEPDRELTLSVLPSDDAIPDVSAVLAIRDDDPVTVLARAPIVQGGDVATVTFTVPELPEGEVVVVDWRTVDGSASSGSDYDAAEGRVTIGGAPSTARGASSVMATATATATVSIATKALTVDGPDAQVRYLTVQIAPVAGVRAVHSAAVIPVGILQRAVDPESPSPTPSPPTEPPSPSGEPGREPVPGGGAVAGAGRAVVLPVTGGGILTAAIPVGTVLLVAGAALSVRRRRRS